MLKQTLLAFTVLGIAGSAAAADITNPFFLPKSLHMASTTSAQYGKTAVKGKNWGASIQQYSKALTEELKFGILDNLSVIGNIEKNWVKAKDRETGIEGKDKNDLNWAAGLAWNILDCKTKLQLSSVYGQDAPSGQDYLFQYHRYQPDQGTYKYFDTELKAGYQFKTFLPYVSFNVHSPVGQTAMNRRTKWNYGGKVGVYQGKCSVWALDTALDLQFDRQTHSRYLSAEAEASYYLTKNTAVGIYGSYMLDGKQKDQVDLYNKTVGARLRLYF